MANITTITAAMDDGTSVVIFPVAVATGVPVAEVAKVEGEVAAVDTELKADDSIAG